MQVLGDEGPDRVGDQLHGDRGDEEAGDAGDDLDAARAQDAHHDDRFAQVLPQGERLAVNHVAFYRVDRF